MTAFLMFVIMAVATDTRAVGSAAAIAIGGTIGLDALFGGPSRRVDEPRALVRPRARLGTGPTSGSTWSARSSGRRSARSPTSCPRRGGRPTRRERSMAAREPRLDLAVAAPTES